MAPRRGVSIGGGETLCPGTVGGSRVVMEEEGSMERRRKVVGGGQG